MTSPSLGRLLISHITLRGPEIEQVYGLIAAQPELTYDALGALLTPGMSDSEFGLADAPLREALNFLLVAGLIEQLGTNRRKSAFRVCPRLVDAPFHLTMLHQLLTHLDARQRALASIYHQLVCEDITAITLPELRTLVERGPHRDLFAWTGEKIGFWSHLMHHLGLVRRLERFEEVLLAPQPELVLAALRLVVQAGDTWHVDSCLRRIDQSLFACFSARGRVHGGLARTLLALERLGRIRLFHHADAVQSVLLMDRRVSHFSWGIDE